jgi:hypothetical protein
MRGNIIAHADFPPGFSVVVRDIPLPIHFDDTEHTWNVGAATDIEATALHEIGHILGLMHETRVGDSVMQPNITTGRITLSSDDIAGLSALYLDNRLYIIQSASGNLHRVDPANLGIEQFVGDWAGPALMV